LEPTTKKKFFFRTNANSEIGFGHLVRCLSLNEILREKIFAIYCHKDIPDQFINQIHQLGSVDLQIQNEFDWINQLTSKDIVVIDLYNYSDDFVLLINQIGALIVRIDDLITPPLRGDILINHAPNLDSAYYDGVFNGDKYLGVEYLLLRPCFTDGCVSKRYDKINRLFISLGGAFKEIEIITLIQGFLTFNLNLNINLLVGSPILNDQLNSLCQKYLINVKYNLNGLEVCKLLDESDLAIVPSSTLSLEAYARNLPVVAIKNANNQKYIFNGLSNEHGVLCFEQEDCDSLDFVTHIFDWYYKGRFEIQRNITSGKIREIFNKIIDEK
jgi:UDP-2,4-diacetamido-2,4,6-trideoxy-beta-L-altropyranose hydrolase